MNPQSPQCFCIALAQSITPPPPCFHIDALLFPSVWQTVWENQSEILHHNLDSVWLDCLDVADWFRARKFWSDFKPEELVRLWWRFQSCCCWPASATLRSSDGLNQSGCDSLLISKNCGWFNPQASNSPYINIQYTTRTTAKDQNQFLWVIFITHPSIHQCLIINNKHNKNYLSTILSYFSKFKTTSRFVDHCRLKMIQLPLNKNRFWSYELIHGKTEGVFFILHRFFELF